MRKNNSILPQDQEITDYMNKWGWSDTSAIGPDRM